MWAIGSSGPGCGMATCGTVGSMTGEDAGTIMVGGSGADEGNADEGNGPDVRCADGICLRPHADFLLASLAAFRSALSVSMNSLSLSMFPYFD